MRYFFKRSLAYLLDCSICYLFVMIVFQWLILSNIREVIGITDEWFMDSINMSLYVAISISLPVWIYFIYFDSNKANGTIGKRVFKLTVLNSTDDQRITFVTSLKRTFSKLLPWEIAHTGIIFPVPLYFMEVPEVRIVTILGMILFIIYIVSILIDKNNQSVYDRLFGTKVTPIEVFN